MMGLQRKVLKSLALVESWQPLNLRFAFILINLTGWLLHFCGVSVVRTELFMEKPESFYKAFVFTRTVRLQGG